MSAEGKSLAPSFAKGGAGRTLLFFCFWLMISGSESAPADLAVGVAAAAAAARVSLRLLPAEALRLQPVALAAFILRFLGQSAVSGADVAWRALRPRLQLRPGFVIYPLQLPPGGARSAFCALSSLLPGTLPTGEDEDGALIVHCLDADQPVVANLAVEEAMYMRAFGHE